MDQARPRHDAPLLGPLTAARPSEHRRRWILVRVALGVLAVAGGAAAWLLLGGDDPRPVTLEEAKERVGGSTLTTAREGEFGPPAAGVYEYQGSGSEHTSFPPLTEAQGPTMPATVTGDGPGCWRFRIDYSSHHWQDWRFCASSTGIATTGGQSFSRRDFPGFQVDNTSTFVCAEPDVVLWVDMQPGDVRPGRCTGTSTAVDGSTTSAGSTTFLGDELVQVEGRAVLARRLRYERTLSGAQEGTEVADWWVDPWTMLPLRHQHQIDLDTRVGSLTVSYREESTFELTSPTPR